MAESIEFFLSLKDNIRDQLKGIDTATSQVTSGAARMEAALNNAGGGALTLKNQLLGVGAALGVGFSAQKLIDLGSNFEDTALSIAGNIKAFNLAATFEEAKQAGSDALDTINKKAAALPGEAGEYIQVFKTALPKAIESGMKDIGKISDFTSQFAAVAISNQIDATQAGFDLMRMLSGQAGLDVRSYTMLAPHIGMAAQQFNRLNAEERRFRIEGALSKFSEQLAAAGDTYSAKIGEAQGRVKELLRLGSEPFFEGIKTALTEMNSWLEVNKKALIDMGNLIAEKIAGGLSWVIENARTLFTVMKNIGEIWIAMKVGMAIATMIEGIMTLVKAMQALRAAAIAASAAEAFATEGLSAIGGAAAAASVYAAFKVMEPDTEDLFKMPEKKAETTPSAGVSTPSGRTQIHNDFRNSRFDIKQEFAEGFDPDRIAVAFASDLARLGEMKVQSQFAPIGSMR